MKILQILGNLTGIVDGKNQSDKGILSLITEKTGKISFRRVAAILVLVKIVIPDVEANGLTWFNVSVIGLCLLASTIKELFKK